MTSPDHYDALETRAPAEREDALMRALALQVAHAQARALAFADQRHDLAAGALVQRRQLTLDLGEVRYIAFLQGRDIVTDLHR